MEEHVLEKAVEDAQLIRKIMDRSTESVHALSNAFIWWGEAFTLVGIISMILLYIIPTPNILSASRILIIVPNVFVALASATIFIITKKKVPDESLNNRFLIIWFAILGYNIIIPFISHLFITPYIDIYMLIPRYSWVSFAVGMLCIRVFGHLKSASWFILFYLFLFLLLLIVPGPVFKSSGRIYYSFSLIFQSYILPISLLLFGALLKLKSRKNAITSQLIN